MNSTFQKAEPADYFNTRVAYWNPHWGACAVFVPEHLTSQGKMMFCPLDAQHNVSFKTREMPLKAANRLFTEINGSWYTDKGTADIPLGYEFNRLAEDFVAMRAWDKTAGAQKLISGWARMQKFLRHDPSRPVNNFALDMAAKARVESPLPKVQPNALAIDSLQKLTGQLVRNPQAKL